MEQPSDNIKFEVRVLSVNHLKSSNPIQVSWDGSGTQADTGFITPVEGMLLCPSMFTVTESGEHFRVVFTTSNVCTGSAQLEGMKQTASVVFVVREKVGCCWDFTQQQDKEIALGSKTLDLSQFLPTLDGTEHTEELALQSDDAPGPTLTVC